MRLTVVAIVMAGLAATAYHFHAATPPDRLQRLEAYYRSHEPPAARPVEPAVVRDGIRAAVAYIQRASLASGQFQYAVHLDPALPADPGYNLLRHAGTIYSLRMAHPHLPEAPLLPLMQRAADFMRGCCFERLHGGDMIGIWEPEELTGTPGPRAYKLGAAGLGLAALAGLSRLTPGAVPTGEMQAIARFGRSMMRRDGEFYALHIPGEGGNRYPSGSLFYPGEMVLGWLMLHQVAPSPELIDWSVKALTYLARTRAAAGEAPPDHWALLATARLFDIAGREGLAIPRDALVQHAVQICHTILESAHGPVQRPELDGSLVGGSRGEVTPTATRLEGLLAALTFLPASQPVRAHVEAAVHRGLAFVLRAQVGGGPHAGGIPAAIAPLPDDGSAETRQFNAQAAEIRIDYVQHALSAMIQYLEWQGAVSAR